MILIQRKTGEAGEQKAKYIVKTLTTFRLETFDERDVIISIMRYRDYVGSLTKENPIFETNIPGEYIFQAKTGFSAFNLHVFSPVGNATGGGGGGSSDCDCEELERKIDFKADKTYVDTELGNKADQSYVDTELGNKADQSYVDTELATKADKTYVDTELATKADKTYVDTELAAIIALADVPFAYQRGATLPSIEGYSVAADRAVLLWPRVRVVDHTTGIAHTVPATALDINSPLVWDDGQYATAANRAGRNFCLYLLTDGTLLLSANSIAPIGHTTADSLKIGGFHCLCVSVGTISGHRLTGFVTGDILPASVWDLMHRPSCSPSGMVYSQEAGIWVDIYLQSGTGANTASVYGGTITDTRNWMDFVDDLLAVCKRLLSDPEFQAIASGSNEKTNIAGSSDPVTTGGHIDTAGRRMISSVGCEDCCGAMWQWLSDQSYAASASQTFAFSWYELPGNKGAIYKQGGEYGDVKLLAGGSWNDGTYCGSRSRNANSHCWATYVNGGVRGCARSHT